MLGKSELTVRQITTADAASFPEALEMLNRTQGRNLFKPSYLDERTASDRSYVVGAFWGGILAGIGVAEIITTFNYYLPFDPEICCLLQGKVVGSFATLCVLESLQGKGVGQAISHERLKWLRSKKCKTVLGVAWASGLQHTSGRVFEKCGFRLVRRVENFYYQISTEQPFVCPSCAGPPCRCAATLYRLEL